MRPVILKMFWALIQYKDDILDKTILRPSYIRNGISYTGTMTFYIELGPWCHDVIMIVTVQMIWVAL